MENATAVTGGNHAGFAPATLLAIVLAFWFVNTEHPILPALFLSLTLIALFLRWCWIVWYRAKFDCNLFKRLGSCAPTCLLLDLCKTRNPVRCLIEAIAVWHSGLAGRRHLMKAHEYTGNHAVTIDHNGITLSEPVEQQGRKYPYESTKGSVNHTLMANDKSSATPDQRRGPRKRNWQRHPALAAAIC